MHLWDVRTGKLLRELEQNVGNAVLALEFSPDGSDPRRLRRRPLASLWDVATGDADRPEARRRGSREAMIDLSPDGRRLLMTHGDGEGAVWDIDPESWARRACTLANRTLTREEWEEFLPGPAVRAGLRELSRPADVSTATGPRRCCCSAETSLKRDERTLSRHSRHEGGRT